MNARVGRPLAVIAVVLIGALVASAPAGAAHARRCGSMTVDGGKAFGGLTKLRVTAVGPVTCAAGRRVVRAWYREIRAGNCVTGGNFCALQVTGGWSCSIIPAGEEPDTGGAPLSCARRAARVRMYPVKR